MFELRKLYKLGRPFALDKKILVIGHRSKDKFNPFSKTRLIDEINAIEDKVDPLTWKSIDAVRKVGNIGAHMEKDINLIIEVDPEEASLLLELIELLFEEWYIHRHEREKKLNAIVAIAERKENEKKQENVVAT